MKTNHSKFTRMAKWAAWKTGRPSTFILAVLAITLWLVSGPLFHFSDTWQLIVNTATTIITFLMVFLIQNTQNRDTEAIQVKLDELIRALDGAQNTLLDLEELNDEELDKIRSQYEKLAEQARSRLRRKTKQTGPAGKAGQANAYKTAPADVRP